MPERSETVRSRIGLPRDRARAAARYGGQLLSRCCRVSTIGETFEVFGGSALDDLGLHLFGRVTEPRESFTVRFDNRCHPFLEVMRAIRAQVFARSRDAMQHVEIVTDTADRAHLARHPLRMILHRPVMHDALHETEQFPEMLRPVRIGCHIGINVAEIISILHGLWSR